MSTFDVSGTSRDMVARRCVEIRPNKGMRIIDIFIARFGGKVLPIRSRKGIKRFPEVAIAVEIKFKLGEIQSRSRLRKSWSKRAGSSRVLDFGRVFNEPKNLSGFEVLFSLEIMGNVQVSEILLLFTLENRV